MQEALNLVIGLGNDFWLIGLLIFPIICRIRLQFANNMKAAGHEDAVAAAWRDIFIASVSVLLTTAMYMVVQFIVRSQAVSGFQVLQ